jgi:hypothetical protein
LRNELTEKDIRQKSPAQPGFSFLMFDCSVAAQSSACHASPCPYFYAVLQCYARQRDKPARYAVNTT